MNALWGEIKSLSISGPSWLIGEAGLPTILNNNSDKQSNNKNKQNWLYGSQSLTGRVSGGGSRANEDAVYVDSNHGMFAVFDGNGKTKKVIMDVLGIKSTSSWREYIELYPELNYDIAKQFDPEEISNYLKRELPKVIQKDTGLIEDLGCAESLIKGFNVKNKPNSSKTELNEYYYCLLKQKEEIITVLQDHIYRIHTNVRNQCLMGSGSTASFVYLIKSTKHTEKNNKIYQEFNIFTVNVGDSRILLFKRNLHCSKIYKTIQISQDNCSLYNFGCQDFTRDHIDVQMTKIKIPITSDSKYHQHLIVVMTDGVYNAFKEDSFVIPKSHNNKEQKPKVVEPESVKFEEGNSVQVSVQESVQLNQKEAANKEVVEDEVKKELKEEVKEVVDEEVKEELKEPILEETKQEIKESEEIEEEIKKVKEDVKEDVTKEVKDEIKEKDENDEELPNDNNHNNNNNNKKQETKEPEPEQEIIVEQVTTKQDKQKQLNPKDQTENEETENENDNMILELMKLILAKEESEGQELIDYEWASKQLCAEARRREERRLMELEFLDGSKRLQKIDDMSVVIIPLL